MRFILVLCFLLFGSYASAQSVSLGENRLLKTLASEASSGPAELQAIRELSKNGVTSKAKALVAQVSAEALFSWAMGDMQEEFEQAMEDAANRIGSADPEQSGVLEQLREERESVIALKNGIISIENELRENAEVLIAFFGLRANTTASPFAVFYHVGLPKIRRKMSSLLSDLNRKIREFEKASSTEISKPKTKPVELVVCLSLIHI